MDSRPFPLVLFLVTSTIASQLDCNQDITSGSGTVTSPNYPEPYPNDIQCEYRFKASEEGQQVFVEFMDFQLEFTEHFCYNDSLTLYDGEKVEDTFIAPLCGDILPGPFRSSGENLLIVFKTNEALALRGFTFNYRFEGPETAHLFGSSECHQNLTGPFGSVMSPNYPRFYPDNAKCEYKITAPPGHKVKAHFAFFNLEHESRCRFDSVKLYDGEISPDTLIAKKCGNYIPGIFKTTTERLFVVFESDGSGARSGFLFFYHFE